MTVTIQSLDKFRNVSGYVYDIYIDGKETVSVGYREKAEFKVPAGTHTMQAKVNFLVSRKLTFEAREYNSMTFTVKSDYKWYAVIMIVIATIHIVQFILGIVVWIQVLLLPMWLICLFITFRKTIKLNTF